MSTLMDYVMERVFMIPESTCWYWKGTHDRDGYAVGKIPASLRGSVPQTSRAHRLSFVAFGGVLESGLQIDHLCRERGCVNPKHLEQVTPRENTMRSPISPAALNARMTHCPRGHLLEGENLLKNVAHRRCLTCFRELDKLQQRRYRRSRRGELFGKWKKKAATV